MQTVHGGVIINEVEAEPLSEYVRDFLFTRTKECPYLDFKRTIGIARDSDFAKIMKDVLAFSNYGGGWMLIGWSEPKSNRYLPEGVPEDYQIDQASLQEKINSYLDNPIQAGYAEYELDLPYDKKFPTSCDITIRQGARRFAVIFIPPSTQKLVPKKDGKYIENGKEIIVFKAGQTFIRRGTQSILATKQEEAQIEKRAKIENYRMSILSGAPDRVEEALSSNLFEVTTLPSFVYLGKKTVSSVPQIQEVLKQEGIKFWWRFKFIIWGEYIITFENIADPANSYSKLVDTKNVKKFTLADWLKDADKNRIIVQLLNREFVYSAMGKGMYYFAERNKLFYPGLHEKPDEPRRESWRTRYDRQSSREVAAKLYSTELRKQIYQHLAFVPSFVQLDSKFYLRMIPSFVISEDGKHTIAGADEGRIITRLSYDRYNRAYFNVLAFWLHKLGEGQNIKIGDISIATTSSDTRLQFGIAYDVPTSELSLEDEGATEQSEFSEEGEYDNI